VKITVTQLKRIIEEELQSFLNEQELATSYTSSETVGRNTDATNTSQSGFKIDKPDAIVTSDTAQDVAGNVNTIDRTIDKNTNLAKGQVSTWKGGKDDDYKEASYVQDMMDTAPTNRGMSESQLKRMIEEMLVVELNSKT